MLCLFYILMSINEVKQEILVFPPVISVKQPAQGCTETSKGIKICFCFYKMPFTDYDCYQRQQEKSL